MATCMKLLSLTFRNSLRVHVINKVVGTTRFWSSAAVVTTCPSSSVHRQMTQLRVMSSQASPPEQREPVSDATVDQPIKFSTSGAHQHRPFDTFFIKDPQPPYQVFSLCISIGIFLIYFLVLREENDLDEELSRTIYERVPALHEKDLLSRIKQAELRGVDTTDLRRELDELRKSVT